MKMQLQMLLCQQAMEYRQFANKIISDSRIEYRYMMTLSNIYTYWADRLWGVILPKTIDVNNMHKQIDEDRIKETNKLLQSLLCNMQATDDLKILYGIVQNIGKGFETGNIDGKICMTCGRNYTELPSSCGVCGGSSNQIVKWGEL